LLQQYETGEESTIFSKTIPNHSAATAKFTVTESFTRKSTFSWGLKEDLKVFAKVTGKVGVPLVAEGSVETGVEVNIGSNQQWTTEDTKQYTISQEVTVPPYTSVKVRFRSKDNIL